MATLQPSQRNYSLTFLRLDFVDTQGRFAVESAGHSKGSISGRLDENERSFIRLGMPRSASSTRSALLDASLEAFANGGFAGASIREITRAVGVRESAFYAHFASKRAAYEELFEESGPPAAARALEAIGTEEPPARFLPQFAELVIDAWSTPRSRKFAAIMLRDAFDDGAAGWRQLMASIDGSLTLMTERFRSWQAADFVRNDAPAQLLAYQFMAPIVLTRFRFLSIANVEADAERGRRLVAEHVATFVTLSAAPPRAPKRS